jgi:hypothetical protein
MVVHSAIACMLVAITGAYVVLQERLRRATHARLWPMPCLPQAPAWEHRTWQHEIRRGREEAFPTEASEKRATKTGQSVTASWTQQSASRMWVDAEVEADGQSWPMHAVPSDLHRRLHADPCERSTLVLHVSATSIFCRSRRAHIPMTRGEAAVQPSSTLMWLLSSGERSQCTTMPAVQGILHAKPRWRGRTKVES